MRNTIFRVCMLTLFGLVFSACTVTTQDGKKTYSIQDVLNTIDQTLSGNPAPQTGAQSKNNSIVFTGTDRSLLSQARPLDWQQLLFGYMQTSPKFDYEEHVDAYMQLFRKDVWKKYRNDEFELNSKRQESILLMKRDAATFDGDRLFVLNTPFEFGEYDFNRQLFPLDALNQGSFFKYSHRYGTYGLPGTFKVRFTNPEIVGNLSIDEAGAKAFVQSRKDSRGRINRKVYGTIYFTRVRLDEAGTEYTADIENVLIYSDSARSHLMVQF